MQLPGQLINFHRLMRPSFGGLILFLILTGAVTGCARSGMPDGSREAKRVILKLTRGDFPVRVYDARIPSKGTVIFGSGDGGWKGWEEHASRALALSGWRVIGWDCRQYATRSYDADTLGRDLSLMASGGRFSASGGGSLIYGGYSTGAEQAVAGAAWALMAENAGKGVVPSGLLLVAPGARSRYGITTSDLMGISPRGSGSFSLSDQASMLGGIPVAQIHGQLDPLDSTIWLSLLSGPHRLFVISGAGHFFGDADAELQGCLRDAVAWLLLQRTDLH